MDLVGKCPGQTYSPTRAASAGWCPHILYRMAKVVLMNGEKW